MTAPSPAEDAPGAAAPRRFLSFLLSSFLLEVCGAAGAVWGFCEILGWRHVENTNDFRGPVTLAFAAFLYRFHLRARHFWEHGREADAEDAKFGPRCRSQLQEPAAAFVLQVMGAAGAVWGASETLRLRHPLTRPLWEGVARGVTVAFLARWLLLCSGRGVVPPWAEATVVTFVLEVCGSTGAVWGFADILAVRDASPDDTEGWRFVALAVGSVFFARWLRQVGEYFCPGWESTLVAKCGDNLFKKEEEGDDGEEEDEETAALAGERVNLAYGSTAASTTDH